jgi:large subunit ribosomal protein L25
VGDAVRVHRGDGVLDQSLFALTVQATPALIPNSIDVDVSGLVIGDVLRVGDLTLPDGVATEVDPEVAIVAAQPPQVTDEDLLTEADVEAAEAAEAAAEAAPEGEGGAATEGGGDAPAASEGGEG